MSTTESDTFMLILRGGISRADLSPDQMQRQIQSYMDWIERLRAKNQFVAGEPLDDASKVLSGKNGRTVTDGPFTESKEEIGGYFIIRAPDLDEACAVAGGCPIFENGGSVEVRPILPVPVPQ